MSDEPINPGRPSRSIDCPECGESFAPRGIASHRRMRHGITPEAAVELSGTLSRIATVLERLDARLSEVKAADATTRDAAEDVAAPFPSRKPVETPGKLLQEGLREVLAEIARVKQETEAQLGSLGERTLSDEQRLLEKTTFQTLSSLRRRQAELLYRLQTEGSANGAAIDPLTTL